MNRTRVLAPWLLLVLVALCTLELHSGPALPGGQLLVCGWDELFILDVSHDTPQKVWSGRAAERPEHPEARRPKYRTTDECKPVDDGKRILITDSSDGVA